MALRNLIIPKKVVPLAGEQSFSVSGVTANQVFHLYHRHRDDLAGVFDRLAGRETDPNQILNSVEGIIASFPLLVAETIALAEGGNPLDTSPADPNFPDGVTAWEADLAGAMALPLPVQVDALMKVAELTFTPDMPPKKFFGLLVAMMQQAKPIAATSTSGSDN